MFPDNSVDEHISPEKNRQHPKLKSLKLKESLNQNLDSEHGLPTKRSIKSRGMRFLKAFGKGRGNPLLSTSRVEKNTSMLSKGSV
mmetsp:Transcript_28324/g.42882  ORF Transcript_28324/g.42882 Transcript_28324/m.42882 type:complete len:85 (-) Transcript_28324:2152-2406(-)